MITRYLDTLDDTAQKVFLIRHAERDPIDDMKNALAIRLTEQGHRESIELGKQLSPLGPFDIYHSPVPRCAETASRIAEGLASKKTKSTMGGSLLDLGGPYVKGDWNELVKRTREKGPSLFLREWFTTEKHHDIMVPLQMAAKESLSLLTRQLKEHSKQVVNISHDWNIIILREFFFGIEHETYGMPPFLDGIVLYRKDRGLYLSYHGKEKRIKDQD